MGIHMVYHAVDAHAQTAVEQWFEHGGCLVPGASHLGESLCLNDVLMVDMCATDGIEHIVRFVMGGGVEPEFPHRIVGMLVVQQSVAYHRRCHTLSRELHTVLFGQRLYLIEEDLVDQFGDGQAHIP